MPLKLSGGNELIDAIHLLEKGGIKLGMTVAALGCGSSGHFVFPAAYLVGPEGRVFAVDILKSVLAAVESRAKLQGVSNVEPIWADLERAGSTRIANESVDVALFCSSLFQLHDKGAGVEEARRMLKQGGALVVAEWKTAGALFGPSVALRMDRAQVESVVTAHGFETKEFFDAGPCHYGLVFRKI